MKSYREYITEAKKEESKKSDSKKQPEKKKTTTPDTSSNKIKCMQSLVAALKKVFSEYDISTRRFTWEKLVGARGEELVAKLLRNPHTYLSNSEFTQLVTRTK